MDTATWSSIGRIFFWWADNSDAALWKENNTMHWAFKWLSNKRQKDNTYLWLSICWSVISFESLRIAQGEKSGQICNPPLMPRELHVFWISVQQWLIPVDKNKHFKSAWNFAGQVVLYLLWVKIKFRLKFLTWVDS